MTAIGRAHGHGSWEAALRQMSLAVLGVLGLWASAVCAQEEPAPGEPDPARVFVEVVPDHADWFVEQPVRVRVLVGFDREFFASRGVQLFRRHLDVPLQLLAPWLEELPGAWAADGTGHRASPLPAVGVDGTGGVPLSFALDDDVVAIVPSEDRLVEGRPFTVLVLERTFLAQDPGNLIIPEARVRFAYATDFRDDFVHGRVPVDRYAGEASSAPVTVVVQALPQEGRPPDFGGAVGRFSVRATLDRSTITLGESLKLSLEVEGTGNLDLFDAPALDALDRFHVYGRLDEAASGRRRVIYDLAPLGTDVRQVPSLSVPFLDPGPPTRYRSAATQALSLDVRRAPPGTELPALFSAAAPPGDEAEKAAPGERAERVRGSRPPRWLLPLLVLPWLLVAWLGWRLAAARRERADVSRGESSRARGESVAPALRPVVGSELDTDDDPEKTLVIRLARRIGCATSAVVDPHLAQRLEAVGVGRATALRAAELLDDLVASRYGGPPVVRASEAVRAAAAELADTEGEPG